MFIYICEHRDHVVDTPLYKYLLRVGKFYIAPLLEHGSVCGPRLGLDEHDVLCRPLEVAGL
jgi:hypothetical protein